MYAIAIAGCLAVGTGGYLVWHAIPQRKQLAASSGVPAAPTSNLELQPVSTDEPLSAPGKQLILSQIQRLSTLTPEKRGRLYNTIDRANSIRKIVEIRFAEGQTDVPFPKEVGKFLATEYVRSKYREDVTAVFLILGFCDPDSGDQPNARDADSGKWDYEISDVRARNVVRIMESNWKVYNVIQGIPMGSARKTPWESIHPKGVGIVEICVVLP